jgi:hypothetical protein
LKTGVVADHLKELARLHIVPAASTFAHRSSHVQMAEIQQSKTATATAEKAVGRNGIAANHRNTAQTRHRG